MKREIVAPILIVCLALAFIFVSLMVYFNETSGVWIRRKLRIGAILLTLAGSATSCQPRISCYEVAPQTVDSTFKDQDSIQKRCENDPTDTVLPQYQPENETH